MKYLSVVLLAGLALAVSPCMSQQMTTKIRNVPIQPTSPASGAQMYTTYCAVCHGSGGTGNGPASVALKTPPMDLTLLSQKNGGKFPADHASAVLRFGVTNPAHGTSEMPIWGDLMPTLSPNDSFDGPIVHQRISNLINYLKTIQK